MIFDRAKTRQFLHQHFDDGELTTLCFDYFSEVHDNFAQGMRKGDKVQDLIGYAERRGLQMQLLAALEQTRPQPFQTTFTVVGSRHASTLRRTPANRSQHRNLRQIFISHAHQDAELAQRLASDLEAEGYPVWIAPDAIRAGEAWVDAVNRGLEESHFFLLLLTLEAVESKWVQKETNVAIELEHDGEMELLPLQIRPCRLPPLWRAYQRISWRRGYDHGLQAILARLRSEPAADRPRQADGLRQAQSSSGSEPVEDRLRQAQSAVVPKGNYVDEKTGLEMIYIPAGDFLYGENKETRTLPDYWISKTPVTHAHYQRFLEANLQHRIPFVNEDWARPYNWDEKRRIYPQDKADHPVVLVSWHDAVAFAEWAGMSLPTEEQWEKAARGTDGRIYPWGDAWENGRCNINFKGTTPVGSYSPQGDSPFGCVDMSGNVWEWCLNKWGDPKDIAVDDSKDGCARRGGSWHSRVMHYAQGSVRSSFRGANLPLNRSHVLGFRLVRVVAHLIDH